MFYVEYEEHFGFLIYACIMILEHFGFLIYACIMILSTTMVLLVFKRTATFSEERETLIMSLSFLFWTKINYFHTIIALIFFTCGHCEAGSLTGAVHLSNDNAGFLRPAQ